MALAAVTLVYMVGSHRKEPVALLAPQSTAADSWIPDVVSILLLLVLRTLIHTYHEGKYILRGKYLAFLFLLMPHVAPSWCHTSTPAKTLRQS